MGTMREVWDKLSRIDVNAHTKTKNGFTYLSWTWCWATLQEQYPESNYTFMPDMWHPDGSCEVWVELTVEGVTRQMWLAVTDYKNKPVINPSCDLIANARMRCFVKAVAMFGLGHYIYAGESLPMEGEKPKDPAIIERLEACETLDELKAEWMKIKDKPLYLDVKDFVKLRLENESPVDMGKDDA